MKFDFNSTSTILLKFQIKFMFENLIVNVHDEFFIISQINFFKCLIKKFWFFFV